MSSLLNVILLRHGGQRNTGPTKLACAADDDFSVALIFLNLAVHFNRLAGQSANVAYITKVRGKDHSAERTLRMIGAEINVLNAARALRDLIYLCRNAGGRTNAARGLFWREAGRTGKFGKKKNCREPTSSAPSVMRH